MAKPPAARTARATTSPQIAAALAAVIARMDGFERTLETASTHAQQARDAAIRLEATHEAEGLAAVLVKLRDDMEAGDQALRQDLVNVTDKIKQVQRDEKLAIDGRLAVLEAFMNRAQGGVGVFGWISRYAPWLMTLVFAGIAALTAAKGKVLGG